MGLFDFVKDIGNKLFNREDEAVEKIKQHIEETNPGIENLDVSYHDGVVSLFNNVVREQITAMKVGERYEKITDAFDRIRDDAKSMVEQLDDGKINTLERLKNPWMTITRGDIPSRFHKIKDTYLEVPEDTKDPIASVLRGLL